MGVLAADLAEEEGLVVPRLSPGLGASISAHVLGTSGTHNPVDAGAAAAPQAIANIAEDMLGSGQVDALLVVLVHTAVSDTSGSLEISPLYAVITRRCRSWRWSSGRRCTRRTRGSPGFLRTPRRSARSDASSATPTGLLSRRNPRVPREIARALTIRARGRPEALARGGQRDLWLDPDAADDC